MAKCSGCSATATVEIDVSPGSCLTVTGTGTPGDPFIFTTTIRIDDLAPFAIAGTLSAPTIGTSRFRFPFDATLEGVSAAVNTAPTGASIILDVNKNGTSIFPITTKPTIAIGAFDTGASEVIPDTTGILDGDYLQIDVDQVGSTIAGADLTVFVRYSRGIVCS